MSTRTGSGRAVDADTRSGWHVLRHRGFTLFFVMRVLSAMATQVVAVAVGWQVYDLTRNPAHLGLIGLFQFAPALLLVLVTGAAADRFNRRVITAVCLAGEGLFAGVILFLTWQGTIAVGTIFILLIFFGICRAFVNPATQSLIPNLVPASEVSSAIALAASSWQVATIVGPAVGGLLYAIGPEVAYGAAFLLFLIAAASVALIPKPPQKTVVEPPNWRSLSAGLRYIWGEKLVLGAISLDLFVVLLGGVVALLPVYARDILEVGPWGLGLMHSAMGGGSLAMALYLTSRPIRDHAGVVMLAAALVFGLSTVVFGLSSIIWLSVAMLALMGAADMISMYVRQTLVQLRTPDEVRGRVNAVNMVFTGASNEIGGFRAGMVAALIGAVPAVVVGGAGIVAVVGLWAHKFPELRRARYLDGRKD
jgi:MFS family permease